MRLLSFNSSRHRLWLENANFAAAVPSGSLVLDAGAGDGPFKQLFSHAQYESADFEQVDKTYQRSTYVCDLRAIPVEDGRFDFIIFNQVMEHLPEPKPVLEELHRVLRPGGRMLYSGPLFYEEHEQPYDYYRYTQFGVRHLMQSAGFEVERLDWLEGYFGTSAYQLNNMARYLPWRPKDTELGLLAIPAAPALFLLKALFAICSVVFHRLEVMKKYVKRGYPKNYLAVVKKPES